MISIVGIGRLSEKEKDLEILVLRQQLAILQRKCHKSVIPNRAEKLTLAILAAKLKQATQRPTDQLRDVIRIFQPQTVMRWHQELVRHKWTYQGKHKGGQPRIGKELDDLILRLAQENPRWGYGKIEGELIKLDFKVSQTTIRNVLDRHNIQPAAVRNSSIGGVTANPNEMWASQQARQLAWELEDRETPLCFLIHDNDRKFSKAFDTLFETEGLHVIHTPYLAPNAPRTTNQHRHGPTSKGAWRDYQRLRSRPFQPCNSHQLRKSQLEKLLPNRRIHLSDIICFGSRYYRAPREYLSNHPFTLLR